jgi:hypothetical protein
MPVVILLALTQEEMASNQDAEKISASRISNGFRN